MLPRCVLTARNYMKHVVRLHLFIYFSYFMITGSVIFYLHTDNQVRVLYIIGLQIGISLLIPRAGGWGGEGYLFLRIFAGCFIYIYFFLQDVSGRFAAATSHANLVRFSRFASKFCRESFKISDVQCRISDPAHTFVLLTV